MWSGISRGSNRRRQVLPISAKTWYFARESRTEGDVVAVLYPAFPERVFEFAFNAEYCHVNRAVLIGTPELPTQNEEKYLGYDVAFEIRRAGGVVNTIALQHKTSRYVTTRSGSNARFYDEIGGPYFAVRLDTEQFNVIEDLASAHMPG